MNYSKIYSRLVSNKTKRKKDKNTYYEEHHIIPKCLGGSDDISNLVLLTAREHLIAHRLLTKIYPNNFELSLAVFFMASISVNSKKVIVTSRVYEELRKDVSAKRIELASHSDCVPLNMDLKMPVHLSNKLRWIKGINEKEKHLTPLLFKYILNLIFADSLGYCLTYPRTKRDLNNRSIIKCEKILIRLGYIQDVVVDNKSPVATKKRCKIIPSEKIRDYNDCLVHVLEINKDFVESP